MNAPAKPVYRRRRAIRREQMSDEVAGHLRAAIMSGTLLPGTFIRLDELGPVEHQDQHPVAEADTATAERTRERRYATVEFSPGGGAAQVSKRCRIGLHQRVPGQLVGPVLPSREIRLIGR